MAVPYTTESDVTGDGYTKLVNTHDSMIRYEKCVGELRFEVSVPATQYCAAAAEGFRRVRAGRGLST